MMFDFTDARIASRFCLRQRAFCFEFRLEIAELGEHLLNRLVTFVRILAQGLVENRFELGWNIWRNAGYSDWLRRQYGSNAVAGCLTAKRRATGHDFVEHYAQAPNVRASVHFLAARLLRRHVTRRT